MEQLDIELVVWERLGYIDSCLLCMIYGLQLAYIWMSIARILLMCVPSLNVCMKFVCTIENYAYEFLKPGSMELKSMKYPATAKKNRRSDCVACTHYYPYTLHLLTGRRW